MHEGFTDASPRRALGSTIKHDLTTSNSLTSRDCATIEHQVQDYPGLASHPFTWEESVEKFDGLVASRIDAALGREIKDAVLSLESIQVRDLVNLLSYAKASSEESTMRAATYPTRKAQ